MFAKQGLSEAAISVIMSSWRPATCAQYASYVNKWKVFLHERKLSLDSLITVNIVLEFLTSLHEQGLSYSAINTARSAVSSVACLIDNISLKDHPLVNRFMRGIFNIKPSLPRYVHTWDVSIVLKYIDNMGDSVTLCLKDLSLKLCMLFALISGQRAQTLAALDITQMFVYEDRVEFNINSLMKQSRPSYHIKPLVFLKYDKCTLCPVVTLQSYLQITKGLRTCTALFISTQKPHKAVSRDTISRWLKSMLCNAGIDTSVYKGHSTRSSCTSKVKSLGVPVNIIMDKAGWTKADTFAKFYDKKSNVDTEFQSALYTNI